MYPQPVVLLTVSNAQMVSLYDNMLVKFVNCPSDLCAAGGAVAGGGGGGGEPLRRTAENLYSPCFGQRGRVIMKIMKENGKTSPWVIVMTGISFIEQLQHCSGVKVRAPACITTKVISRLNTTHRSFGEMDRFFCVHRTKNSVSDVAVWNFTSLQNVFKMPIVLGETMYPVNTVLI